MKANRRTFIKMGITGGLAATTSQLAAAGDKPPLHPTPAEIEGPFYPVTAQKDKDFDLTRIDGVEGTAAGKPIFIEGAIVDVDANPIEDVWIELWQANAAGRYSHPKDTNPAPLDPNFQGWAIVPSGAKGEFRFKTVIPGSYPAADGWIRPPHIHFKVSKQGYAALTTQMYFPGQVLNERDQLLKRKGKEDQESMIATKAEGDPETYRFRIVIRKA